MLDVKSDWSPISYAEAGLVFDQKSLFTTSNDTRWRYPNIHSSGALSWAVAQLVETLRYKPGSGGFDSRWRH